MAKSEAELSSLPLLPNEARDLIELKRRGRAIIVPTDDGEVRSQLRQLKQPVTLFGEDKGSRRDRLRRLLAELDLVQEREGVSEPPAKSARLDEEKPKEETDQDLTRVVWYHEGSQSLVQARYFMAQFSLPRAQYRLQIARALHDMPIGLREAKKQALLKQLQRVRVESSQIGDSQRPLSYVAFSASGSLLATASLSGAASIWRVPSCERVRTLKEWNCACSCVAWHPQAALDGSDPSTLSLATAFHDGSVKLWSLDSDEPLGDMDGHQPYRVGRLAFHPSGRFLATCCFDRSWRLWDLTACDEVLHQEGHSGPVYDIVHHPDGSLIATGGLDSHCRVWDLRSGHCIQTFQGHQQPILSIDFAPAYGYGGGYILATGSEDNSVRIWDLRSRKLSYTIPAHTKLVSRVKFQPDHGLYLATASYDETIKLWTPPNWTPVRTLQGQGSKVMCIDVLPPSSTAVSAQRATAVCPAGPAGALGVAVGSLCIASGGFDRTFKLWTPEDDESTSTTKALAVKSEPLEHKEHNQSTN